MFKLVTYYLFIYSYCQHVFSYIRYLMTVKINLKSMILNVSHDEPKLWTVVSVRKKYIFSCIYFALLDGLIEQWSTPTSSFLLFCVQ